MFDFELPSSWNGYVIILVFVGTISLVEVRMDFVKLILSAVLSVAMLFIITKLMGHKQVAQLDFFDYVSGITIGSIGAELATELESPWKPLVALVIYGLVSMLLNFLAHKFPKTRKYINGTPTILLNDGKIYRKNLKKAKLDLSEFLLLCREQGYFDLSEIQTAIFEHNGKLSVLPKSQKRPVTPEDIGVAVDAAHIGTEVIMDGRVMGENLKRIGRDEKWLKKELSALGCKTVENVFLGIYNSDKESLKVFLVE